MNSPNPVPATVNAGASMVAGTVGGTLGGILSVLVAAPAASVGIPPIITQPVVTGFAAWLAHWMHQKLGTPE
jgi:hypothetical protein